MGPEKKQRLGGGVRDGMEKDKGFLGCGIVATQGPRPEGLVVRRVLAGGSGSRGCAQPGAWGGGVVFMGSWSLGEAALGWRMSW